MIVVTAIHGERIHGWLRDDIDTTDTFSYDRYLQACAANRTPVGIQHARNLVGQKDVRVDGQGNLVAVVPMMALMPIDMLMGPMEEYSVIPSSWYFPGSMKTSKDIMEKLLTAAEASEVRNRAAAAGIQTAGIQPARPHIVPPRGH